MGYRPFEASRIFGGRAVRAGPVQRREIPGERETRFYVGDAVPVKPPHCDRAIRDRVRSIGAARPYLTSDTRRWIGPPTSSGSVDAI